MIVETLERDVRASAALVSQEITILASPDVVRSVILPYTDMPLAAVRETLIGNHLDASNYVEVQLPTRLDPTWVSRDFGPGIPYAQIHTHFSQAGYSTKTNTNTNRLIDGTTVDVMGCKGRGRFAPLGVTDQFLITNWSEGRRVIGQVYFDHRGMPKFDIISDVADTTSPTGVEIRFAVDQDKVGAVLAAVEALMQHVDPTVYNVEFTGHQPNVNLDKPEWHGNGWQLNGRQSTAKAVMGRIAYDVNSWQFYGTPAFELLQSGLQVKVPLGSIEVNDARESVVYSDKTKAAITAAVDAVKQEVHDTVFDSVNNAPTYWEACSAFSEVVDRWFNGTFGKLAFQWKGRDVKNVVLYDFEELPSVVAGDAAAAANTGTKFSGNTSIYHTTNRSLRRSSGNGNRLKFENAHRLPINPLKSTILIRDVETRASDIIAHWYASIQGDRPDVVYMLDASDPILQEKLDLLGNPPTTPLSTLPVPPKTQRTSSARSITKMKRFDTYHFIDDNVDLKQPAIYIKMHAGAYRPGSIEFKLPSVPAFPGTRLGIERACLIVRSHQAVTGNTDPIVAVPATLWDRIPKNGSWRTLEDAAADAALHYDSTPDIVTTTLAHYARGRAGYDTVEGSIPDYLFDKHYPAADSALLYLLQYGYYADIKFKFKKALLDDLAAAPLLRYLVRGNAPAADIQAYLKSCNVTI
jgi:hypothetical protein